MLSIQLQEGHPALCTVTFLSGCGAPVAVFDSRVEDAQRCYAPPRSYVSYPVPGKHISFFGDLFHGAPGAVILLASLPPNQNELQMISALKDWLVPVVLNLESLCM